VLILLMRVSEAFLTWRISSLCQHIWCQFLL